MKGPTPIALEDRFWSKVDQNGPVPEYRPELGPCWVWTASLAGGGYGQIYNPRGSSRAHRLSFEWAKGTIPDGLVLDHLCRVRRCVNPDHLQAVPQLTNAYRGTSNAVARFEPTCGQGHPWTDESTRWSKKGLRTCRICHRIRQGEYIKTNPEQRAKAFERQARWKREKRAKLRASRLDQDAAAAS